jgi:hypothetical protein
MTNTAFRLTLGGHAVLTRRVNADLALAYDFFL